MRGLRARIAAWVVGAALLGALAACPPAKPPVNPTPDADAAPPAPPPPSCLDACGHYGAVCANSLAVCNQTCPGPAQIDPGYTTCLAGATGCMNCDATARAGQVQIGKPNQHGR